MADTMMGEVIEYLAKGLVDNPEEVRVTETRDGDRVEVRLDVGEDDWGKVIGKGGQTAKALRKILSAAATKLKKKSLLQIVE